MRLLAVAALTLLAGQAFAQSDYRKHNIRVAVGGAMPRGELRDYFSTAPILQVGYGYRFHEYFQADIGFETVFGAADVRDFIDVGVGPLRIRDFEYFLPMGGRVVVPFARERVHFTAGGGGAYMRYSERIRQPFGGSGYTIDCPVCTSRDGWGYYGVSSISFALDSRNMFRIGATGKVYRGHTDGEPLGFAPPLRTRDHWVNIAAEFSVNF